MELIMEKFWITTALICGLVLSTDVLNGQIWLDLQREGKTLVEINKEVDRYISTINNDKKRNRLAKHFYRWKTMVEPYYTDNISPIEMATKINTQVTSFKKKYKATSRNNFGNWENVTPEICEYNDEEGRTPVWDIYFDETYDDRLYACAQAGLYRKDGTGDWEHLTQELYINDASGVVAKEDTIFLLTGAHHHHLYTGIYESFDGGQSWSNPKLMAIVLGDTLVLDFYDSPNFYGWLSTFGLFANPSNIKQTFALTSNGVYERSSLGSTYWLRMDRDTAGTVRDLEFHPTDHDTIFAASNRKLYRTIDGGLDWAVVDNVDTIYDVSTIAIAPSNPDIIYAFYIGPNVNEDEDEDEERPHIMRYSDDAGETWITLDEGIEDINCNQRFHNLQMVVNPQDVNEVFVFTVYPYEFTKSGNSGSFSGINGDVHPDFQDALFHDDVLYVSNDGGINVNTTLSSSGWDGSISQGMKTLASVRFDVHNNQVITGNWHNGCQKWTIGDNETSLVCGGDGFGVFYDPSNPSDTYAMNQGNGFYHNSSYVSGPNWSDPWGQPFFQDPGDSDIIYYCNSGIYQYSKSDDEFTEPIDLTDSLGIKELAVCAADNDIAYAIVQNSTPGVIDTLYKLDYGNNTATDITANLHPDMNIELGVRIKVHPNICNYLYWIEGSFNAPNVFFSANGGDSWSPINYNLPSIRPTDILIHPTTYDLYLATYTGVWYLEGVDNWVPMSMGLGYKKVHRLDIDNGYLYAMCYGNGVWRTLLPSACPTSLILTNGNDPSDGFPGFQRYSALNSIDNSRSSEGSLGTNVEMTSEGLIRLLPGFRATAPLNPKNDAHFNCYFKYSIEDCIID